MRTELATVLQDGSFFYLFIKTLKKKNNPKTTIVVQKRSAGKDDCWSRWRDFRDSCGRNSGRIEVVIRGGDITEISRLQAFMNRVLLEFEEKVLPDTVVIGYMSFGVLVCFQPYLLKASSSVCINSQYTKKYSL